MHYPFGLQSDNAGTQVVVSTGSMVRLATYYEERAELLPEVAEDLTRVQQDELLKKISEARLFELPSYDKNLRKPLPPTPDLDVPPATDVDVLGVE